jgi:hypothetical protein
MMTKEELEDATHLHYSRVLWKSPRTRRRLLYMWEHPDHPDREQFERNRSLVVGFLECEDTELYVDTVAGRDMWSVRSLTREIPRTMWQLWDESKELAQKQL